MNDCFWAFISEVCSGENCNECKDYISANSDKGKNLLGKYQQEVEDALQPVYARWKAIKEKESAYNESCER